MALMDDLRSKLAAIGDAIRRKTGGSTELSLDDMVTAINGISTGGSGGTGGGGSSGSSGAGEGINLLENGYTVNFFNIDNVLFESHACLYDFWIDQPLSYPVHHWENADGYMNQFPLTVTEDDAEDVFDLYPVVVGENACYLINPNGTDFGTTFLQADGTAQSGYKDNSANGGFFPNYTENAYKLYIDPQAGSTKWGKHTFNDPIKCSGYRYLKLKWYYTSVYYAGSDSASFYIKLSKDVDSTDAYRSIKINTYYNYNLNYYRSITGNSELTEEDILNDVSNPAWRWTIIDISDLDEFYLTIEGSYDKHIAELIMTK